MSKVLVTGAQGLLGSTLVPYLSARGHQVIRLGRSGECDVCADLTDAGQTARALDQAAPEVIVNLAALTNVDECERNPRQAYLANVKAVENLARWIRERGNGCHLVQVSTDQVYDGVGPYKEDDVVLTNYYGFSKYAGELAAMLVSSTILRTNFFGPSQCASRTSLSDWLVRSLNNGAAITVFDDVHFSPLSIQRLVESLELAVVKRRQGVYNLGSKDGMSKADFAFTLAQVLNLPTASIRRGTSDNLKLAAYRPKDMRIDASHFEAAFNVELPTLKEEIHSMKVAYASKAG